jgi:hypothetical protein
MLRALSPKGMINSEQHVTINNKKNKHMKNRIFSFFILVMYVSVTFAQSELDAYKYIIIPKKYDFLKEEDRYQINSLTKFLFEKKGFNALFEDETYPADLLENPCLATTAYVVDDSSMFTTKLYIELKDCHNKTIYKSAEGKSKEKDYKKTYNDALRKSFSSIEEMDYSFNNAAVASTKQSKQVVNPEPSVATPQTPEVLVSVVPVAVPEIINESDKEEAITDAEIAEESQIENSILKSYKNEAISFFIMNQNQKLVAIVNQSKTGNYKKGEQIGTLTKTSLPNIYKATWKNSDGKNEETTAYFDASGNLNVDINRNGKIEVVVFQIEN